MTHSNQGRSRRSGDPFDDLVDTPASAESMTSGASATSSGRRPDGTGRAAPTAAVYRRRRWAAAGVAVVLLVTLVVLFRAVFGGSDGPAPAADNDAAAMASVSDTAAQTTSWNNPSDSPGPLPGVPTSDTVGALPPGGTFSRDGDGTWHGVGTAGAVAGDPSAADTRTVSYVVEVEDGLDTASFGGGDAFAAMVDATLDDPRSWIGNTDDRIAFRHISVAGSATPDLRVRLTTPETTRELCGGEIELETSCFISGNDAAGTTAGSANDGRVIINVARWVRGALPFAGDLGSYRQYVLNHEIGHGIGHGSHEPCPTDGTLAPIMMQQTLSLANRDLVDLDAGAEYTDDRKTLDAVCVMNAWPHPEG